MGFAKTWGLLALALGVQAAVEPIVTKGTKFYYANGTQFFIRGVAYQQDSQAKGAVSTSTTYTDPLANATNCARDIPNLQKLGTNVIRTYAIDPTADHSSCMNALANAGIYVISDLSDPADSINQASPGWNVQLYARYTAVIDELSKYPNVIGFFAGNEVTNNASNTNAAAYVKAAVRDMKAYIKSKNLDHWLGVGYAADDDPSIRSNIAHYFNCGDQSEAIDFWGYNMYEWCGPSSFTQSGYDVQVQFFQNYSVPVFFAEYGCNTYTNPKGVTGAEGRLWTEVGALYGPNMTGVFSGGIVYMYFEEANDYGIVTIQVNGAASTMSNFNVLSTQLASATPSSTASAAYTPTNSPAACPAIDTTSSDTTWVSSNNLPPTPNNTVCSCMFQGLSCVPKSSLALTSYGDIFNTACAPKSGADCSAINGNVTTGSYGIYSTCNDTQKLGFVMDSYYKAQKSASSACDFSGSGQVVSNPSSASTCSAALASASASASASGPSSSASSSSFAVPVPMHGVKLGISDVVVGLYVIVAMGAGAGMVLL